MSPDPLIAFFFALRLVLTQGKSSQLSLYGSNSTSPYIEQLNLPIVFFSPYEETSGCPMFLYVPSNINFNPAIVTLSSLLNFLGAFKFITQPISLLLFHFFVISSSLGLTDTFSSFSFGSSSFSFGSSSFSFSTFSSDGFFNWSAKEKFIALPSLSLNCSKSIVLISKVFVISNKDFLVNLRSFIDKLCSLPLPSVIVIIP